MKNRFKSMFVVLALFAGGVAILTSCTEAEKDQCEKTIADTRIVNVGTQVQILRGTTPVDSVEIEIKITYLPCGSTEADPTGTYTGFTDTNGILSIPMSKVVNIVMNNTIDRVQFFAVAPNLVFEQKNYDEEYLYYDEITTAGVEIPELIIYAKPN